MILHTLIQPKSYLILLLLGSLGLFVASTITLVIVSGIVALVFGLISAVFVYRYVAINVGIPVDTFWEGLITSIAGMLLLGVLLYLGDREMLGKLKF
ncbi:MAG: hypothetical protein ACQESG_07895 [Nanobdellota archaeon]